MYHLENIKKQNSWVENCNCNTYVKAKFPKMKYYSWLYFRPEIEEPRFVCILSFWKSYPSIFTHTCLSTSSNLGLKPQVAHQSTMKAIPQNGIAQMEETKWCVLLYTKDD